MGRMDSAGHFAMIPPLRTLTVLAWLFVCFLLQAFRCVIFLFARYNIGVFCSSTTAENLAQASTAGSWCISWQGHYSVITVS